MLTEYDIIKRAQSRKDVATSIAVTKSSAYSTGNILGGLITLSSPNSPTEEPSLCSILQSLAIMDPDSQAIALDLFFFNQLPASTFTDKTAFAPSVADLQNCIGVVHIASTDFIAAGASGDIANVVNLGRVIKSANGGTSIYCVPVIRGTPTYTNGNLYFRFQFSQGL